MSLLMEALKQAEHAKHGARTEAPPPAAAPAVPASMTDAPGSLAELSLAPVETGDPDATVEQDNPLEPDIAEPLHATSATLAEVAPHAMPDVALAESRVSVAPPPPPAIAAPHIGHTQDNPATAGRILTASAAHRAAQRRRTLIGAVGLASIVAIAVGSYYYYAVLAQQNPYLGLPQPPALAAADTLIADGGVDAAVVMGSDGSEIAAVAATVPQDAAPAASTDTAPPAQTPWLEGPPPAEPAITRDWEPVPVDVRVLRGEQPLPVADTGHDTAQDSAPPAAAITITRGSQPDQVSLDLQTAYADFQAGRLVNSEQGYQHVLARDAGNRDAHLGLAAIAVRNGRLDTARAHYRAILQRNPKDVTVQAALTDLGQAHPADSESQLKLLLTEQPDSAPLHFALANLYAAQQRWDYAQQAYFEAQRLAPGQPDYAFNLAVSLEHLGQPRLALDYYRRALALAGQGGAQFDLVSAQQRVAALGAEVQP